MGPLEIRVWLNQPNNKLGMYAEKGRDMSTEDAKVVDALYHWCCSWSTSPLCGKKDVSIKIQFNYTAENRVAFKKSAFVQLFSTDIALLFRTIEHSSEKALCFSVER